MKIIERLKQRWIAWVWRHTPGCADMSRLASQSLEKTPPLGRRLKMRLHFLVCVWCKRYYKQLKFLHEAVPRFQEHAGTLPGRGLSAEARKRMMQRLQGPRDE